jgi:hypothetical protein
MTFEIVLSCLVMFPVLRGTCRRLFPDRWCPPLFVVLVFPA